MNILRKLSLLTLLLISSIAIHAATVVGRIVDTNKAPLGYVNVILKGKTSSSKPLGTVSNDKGVFRIADVPAGNYTVEISFVGYKTATKNITVPATDDVHKAGLFTMREDTGLLEEVQVVGQASQMKFDIDKKVFNVEQSLSTAGASASDMLQNIPSVEVDNEGNISLRNSTAVEVWINGKPSGLNADNRAQILEQMPAGTIQSVELITNPSAKYSPEGSAGIINLVLKKDRKAGYYGSVNAGMNYNIGSSIPGANVGLSFNYNSSKIDAYVNLGGRFMNFESARYNDRYTLNPHTKDTLSFLSTDDIGDRTFGGTFLRAGFDARVADNHSLGLSVMGHLGGSKSDAINHYELVNYNPLDTTLYQKTNISAGYRYSFNASLDYNWTINELGSEWRTSIDFGGDGRQFNNEYEQSAIQGIVPEYLQTQELSGSPLSSELKSDFLWKFNEDMKLEVGLNGSWENHASPSRLYNVDNNGTPHLQQYNDFSHEEYIGALYAMYGAKFGNFNMSLGIRGEYVNTTVSTRDKENGDYHTTDSDYFQFYPTAFFAYSLPKNNELQVNYTRRVNRPHGRQLNLFRDVSDSTNISFGNPYLTPSFTDAVELNYIKTWDAHALTASLYYKHSNDIIQHINYLAENNVMMSTYENISSRHSAGIELVAKNRIARWVNLTTTVNGYYSLMKDVYYDTNSDGTPELLSPEQSSFSWSARLMANFIAPMGWSGQLTAGYRSSQVVAQGSSMGQYTLDIGIRKSFLDNSLNLSLTARDLLGSRSWRSIRTGDNFWQYSEYASRGTMLSLTASYSFGNMKGKRKKGKRGESSESMDMEGGDDFGF